MPRKLCAYGFDCRSMMMDYNLEAEDCPNKNVCGLITTLTEEEQVELYQAQLENNQRIVVRVRMNERQAASHLLTTRGCPQTTETLGLISALERLKSEISLLESAIEELNDGYIAPREVEAHRYIVKRPYGAYEYNKLASKKAIFEPQKEEDKVKVIHLSKDQDKRNIIGRYGIERRNKLLAIKTKIESAIALINETTEMSNYDLIDEKVARKITNIEH